MFSFLNHLSDNHLAMLGCLGVIGTSILLLAASYHGSTNNLPASVGHRRQSKKNRSEERISERRAA